MTPEQEKQFARFGCGTRCLIRLAELRQKPVDKHEVVARFTGRFPEWQTQCGGTVTSMLIDIARDLGLCVHADTMISLHLVKRALAEKLTNGVLLMTERRKDANGDLVELNHCRLVIGLDGQDRLRVWNPKQDGSESDREPITEEEIAEQLGHFIVFY